MRTLFFSLLLLISCSAFSESSTSKTLNALLEKEEYFCFRDSFLAAQPSLNEFERNYFFAWNESLFGNAETSDATIDLLIRQKDEQLNDTMAAGLLELKVQNCLRIFRYKDADSACRLLTSMYTGVLEKEELENIKNTQGIVQALLDVPAQTVERNGDLSMDYKRDIAGLIRIPVSIGGKEQDFIMDTGANLSTICESEAKRMGVKILHASFGVTSSSKASVGAKLGLADELTIGNVVFHHVPFIVLPDKSLKFAGGLYKIKGIVGLPVIAQLGEVQVTKKGKLLSPLQQTDTTLHNLGMSGNTMFANVSFYGYDHPYIFDTGAATTVLNAPFLTAYNDSLSGKKEKKSHVGGAGGTQKIDIIYCSNLPYSLGGRNGKLKHSMVQVSGSNKAYGNFYGIVGEDIFTQWEVMTINFSKQFVVFH